MDEMMRFPAGMFGNRSIPTSEKWHIYCILKNHTHTNLSLKNVREY
jgi:hypothetical protein